jgi:hypothetical protein
MTTTAPSLRHLARALAWWCLTGAVQAQTPAASTAVPLPAESAAASGGPSLTWSGFGTLGWAQSNRDWASQRFIDRKGDLRPDSVLGAQVDLQFGSHWSAAVQAKLAPSNQSDSSWRLRPTWAFVAWRPDNDWLLRAGKLRLPAYLRSEQLDVAATYDQARLPAEIYGVLPSEDLDSINVTRSWSLGSGDISLDVYGGRSKQSMRVWVREGVAQALPSGANFLQMTSEAQGLVATWNGADSKARLGVHRVVITPRSGITLLVRPSWAALGPTLGYWQTHPDMPGPGVETVKSIENYYLAGGFEFSPLAGWRVTSEFNRIRPVGTERSIDTRGAYVNVTRQLDRWSPYVTWGRLQSSAQSLAWARTLDETTLPAGLPGASELNASMRAAADTAPVYDQTSWAVGGAYAITPASKLKAEWLHTRAKVSSMFDLPSGEKLFQPRSVDVLSVNYSFTF